MLHLSKENDIRNAITRFFISKPIFGVNVRVAQQIYVFKVRSCLAISKGIKATICKINNFSFLTSICPNYYCRRLSCAKTVMDKFSFNELTQSSAKFFCISVFKFGSCLASCLTFRPFLTLDPKQLGCLYIKNVNSYIYGAFNAVEIFF